MPQTLESEPRGRTSSLWGNQARYGASKEIILALAIVVVLNLFINYGVFTFYKPPKYEVFCPVEPTQKQYPDEVSCKAVGGQWFENGGDIFG